MPTHQRDSFIDIAVEEFDAENSAGGTHKMNIEHPTSNAEIERKPEFTIQIASILLISHLSTKH